MYIYICIIYIYIHTHRHPRILCCPWVGPQELPGSQNGSDTAGYPKEAADAPLLKLSKEEARPLACFGGKLYRLSCCIIYLNHCLILLLSYVSILYIVSFSVILSYSIILCHIILGHFCLLRLPDVRVDSSASFRFRRVPSRCAWRLTCTRCELGLRHQPVKCRILGLRV